ncbi:MAG TPA: hypothetical protein VIQ79_03915 [Kribbella sp.]
MPDRRGRRIGVFGLVNMLGQRGYLSAEEEEFRRTTNAWYDATYTNPSTVDPTVYEANLRAAAWFRSSAAHLMEPLPGYLAILAAHNVPCERYESPEAECCTRMNTRWSSSRTNPKTSPASPPCSGSARSPIEPGVPAGVR